jgi:hypothetical protein
MADGVEVVDRTRCLSDTVGLKYLPSTFLYLNALSLLALGNVGAESWDPEESRLR